MYSLETQKSTANLHVLTPNWTILNMGCHLDMRIQDGDSALNYPSCVDGDVVC